jgi:hypothetical protein
VTRAACLALALVLGISTPTLAAGKGRPAAAAKKKARPAVQLGSATPAWDALEPFVPASDGLVFRTDVGLLFASLPASTRNPLMALAANGDDGCAAWLLGGALRDVVVLTSFASASSSELAAMGFAPGTDHTRAVSCATIRWKHARREGDDIVGDDASGKTQHMRWLPGTEVLVWSTQSGTHLTAFLAAPTATPSPEITARVAGAPMSAPIVIAGAGDQMNGSMIVDLGKDGRGFDITIDLTLDKEESAKQLEAYWPQLVGNVKAMVPPELIGFISRAVLQRSGSSIKVVTTISHAELVALASYGQKQLAALGLISPPPTPAAPPPPPRRRKRP